ncbi:MAG: rRNA maturation RNase YbeY [Vicinamibacterales bacterium]
MGSGDTGSKRLRVSVTDGRGRPVKSPLGRWLTRWAPARARGVVTIALITNPAMRRLNRDYRGKDYPTDVLSFPAEERGCLGDIAIAKGVAARQARALGHTVETELKVLALHGLLHLLGHDHETDAGEMARMEERLRRKAGLPSGLIARASTRPQR